MSYADTGRTLGCVTNRHRALGAAVALMWGLNFLAIHLSLAQFPPLFLVALRFALIAVPTVLFVPRPQVPTRWLLGYGLGFGVAQFTFLYLGMAAGMPTGLASLVLQSSAPFTLLLGALLLREHVHARQWSGIVVATAGLALVGAGRTGAAGLVPFLLVVLAGLGWAFGNLANRQARPPKPLHLTLWMSVVVPLPMLALSLCVEGPGAIAASLATSLRLEAIPAWAGLVYTVLIATVAGAGLWTWLLARHPAGVVAPFSMLVPVVGIATGAVVLHEIPTRLELLGALLVVVGVLVGSWTVRRPAAPTSGPVTTAPPAAPVSSS